MAVLYDSSQDQALFLPLAATALKIQSCATEDECLVPGRAEVTCIQIGRKDRNRIVALELDQGSQRIAEPDAVEAISIGLISLYFRDLSGTIIDILVAGTHERPYL